MDRHELKAVVEDIAKHFDLCDIRGTGFTAQERRIKELLDKKYGGIVLGSGNFSTVVRIDVLPNMAVKISRDPHDAWLAWAMHCMIYKPSFGMEVHMIYIGADYYIAVMPEYDGVLPNDPVYISWADEVYGVFTHGIGRHSTQEQIMVYDMIKSVGARDDTTSRNAMRTKDGRYVVTDPIYGGDPTKITMYINKFQTMAQKLQYLFVNGGDLSEQRRREQRRLEEARSEPEVRAVDAMEPLRAVVGREDKQNWLGDIHALLQMQRGLFPQFAADPGAIKRMVGVEWSAPKFIRRSARRPFNAVLRTSGSMARQVRNGRRHGEIVRFLREQFPGQALYASLERSKTRPGIWYLRISSEGTKRPIAEIPFQPQHSGGWSDVELRQLRCAIAAGLDRRHHERVEGRKADELCVHFRDSFVGRENFLPPKNLLVFDPAAPLARRGPGGGQGPPQDQAAA